MLSVTCMCKYEVDPERDPICSKIIFSMLIAPGMSDRIASTIRYVTFVDLARGVGVVFFCISAGSGGLGGSVFVGAVGWVLLQPRPSLNKPSGSL